MPGAAQQAPGARRWRVGLVVIGGLAVVAAAVLAGVLGPRKAARGKSPSGITTQSAHDNPYTSLVNGAQLSYTPNSPTPDTHTDAAADSSASATTDKPSSGDSTTTTTETDGLNSGADDANKQQQQTQASAPPPGYNTRPYWQDVVDAGLNAVGVPTSGTNNPWAVAKVTAWQALGGAPGAVCYPQNGKEVIQMASGTQCTLIILTRHHTWPYTIDQVINITSPKVIVGNPIDTPALNASKVVRLFDVYPGGSLDLRSVQLYRGNRYPNLGNLLLYVGATIRVWPGARLTCTGVTFRDNVQTVERWLTDLQNAFTQRQVVIGGHVLVLGGTFFHTGSVFVQNRPLGSPTLQSMNIGRDICIIGGNGIGLGQIHVSLQLFANTVIFGNAVSVLGGTYTWVGGTIANANGAQAQYCVGAQLLVTAGVLVTVGFTYETTNGIVFRAGMGQFTTVAGVLFMVDYVQVRAWGIGCIFKAGQTHAVGAGVQRIVGGAVASTAAIQAFAGIGGTSYTGTGTMAWIGVPQARSAAIQTQIGAGMVYANGAGYVEFILVPQATGQALRSQFGIGTDTFIGMGLGIFINNTRFTVQGITGFWGEGNQVWIGLGGGLFLKNIIITYRWINYSTTNNTYTVHGAGVDRAQAQRDFFLTKDGVKSFNISYLYEPQERRDDDDDKGEDDRERDRRTNLKRLIARRGRELGLSDADLFKHKQSLWVVGDDVKEYKIDLKTLDTKRLPSTPHFGSLAEVMQAQEGGLAKVAKLGNKPLTVSVNNTKSCFVCADAEAEVTGGDAGTCEVAEDCNRDTLEETVKVANEKSSVPLQGASWLPSLSTNGESVELPSLHLTWHEVVLYCTDKTPACANEAIVKKAVVDAIGLPQPDVAYAVANVALPKVARMVAVPELLNALVPEERVDLPTWSKFNVWTTSKHEDDQKDAVKAWAAIEKDPSVLMRSIQDELDRQKYSDVELGAITVKHTVSSTYPSIDAAPAFTASSAGQIGPSVLVASDRSIIPLTELVAGQPYRIIVQNFPRGAKVKVALRQACATGDKEVETAADISSFEDDGAVEVEWVAPTRQGKYYFLATQHGTALFAFSPAFEVVTKSSRPGRRY